jgi:hypothetical protein
MLKVMERRVGTQLSGGRVFAWVLDMKHLFENSPRRVDTVLDKLSNDQFTIRLELDQLDEAIKSVNRSARRLALSVLVGSAIIGGGFILEFLRKPKRSGQ